MLKHTHTYSNARMYTHTLSPSRCVCVVRACVRVCACACARFCFPLFLMLYKKYFHMDKSLQIPFLDQSYFSIYRVMCFEPTSFTSLSGVLHNQFNMLTSKPQRTGFSTVQGTCMYTYISYKRQVLHKHDKGFPSQYVTLVISF